MQVMDAVGGPQRDDPDFADIYGQHTPGATGEELFSAVMTYSIPSHEVGRRILFMPEMAGFLEPDEGAEMAGSVVEIEETIAQVDESGAWQVFLKMTGKLLD